MKALRETVRGFLLGRDYDRILTLAKEERRVVRTVVSLLYDGEDLVRWRAVTLMGRLARTEPEKVKALVKRFIWWMNDESGGIGWSSAPAIGEIGRSVPGLVPDAVRVVIHYRQERFLIPGVLWATGRLAGTFTGMVAEVVPELIGFLADKDADVRGQAVFALGETRDRRAEEGLRGIGSDESRIRLYENEDIVVKEIGIAAGEALQKVSGGF